MSEKPSYLKKRKTTPSAVSFVIERLTNAISDGELKPGDKLPTEYELAESLGVGRNAVREAVKVLEFVGILEIRHSGGTFISTGFKVELFNPLIYGIILKSGYSQDVYDFRQSFEIGAMLLALATATDEDILHAEKALQEYVDALTNPEPDYEKIIDKDINFHMSFCFATHNELITVVGELINKVTRYSRIQNIKNVIERNQIEHSIEIHQNLLSVLKYKDAANIQKYLTQCYEQWHLLLQEESF